jgi:hypothetical protein
MNAITQLDVLDLEDTIARYGVGELIRYWPAVNGIENSNYFLRMVQDGQEREYVLTIMEQPANSGASARPIVRPVRTGWSVRCRGHPHAQRRAVCNVQRQDGATVTALARSPHLQSDVIPG